jgi:hypothetical protein
MIDTEARQVHVAVVGHVHRHAVDEQRHLAAVEAAQRHQPLAPLAHVLRGHARHQLERLRQVVTVLGGEGIAGDAVHGDRQGHRRALADHLDGAQFGRRLVGAL